ncbi:MAG: flagellar hook protein FlgE [Campylobacter sp.]
MLRTFYNGVSGIKTHSYGMDVWANNISNINNVGFTGSIPEFKSIFYQTVVQAGNNPTRDQVGLGATKNSTSLTFYKQGSLQVTDNKLDMAIAGEGFFGVRDNMGNTLYTRAGSFGINSNYELVNNEGKYVLGTQNKLVPTTPSANAIAKYGTLNGKPYDQAYTLAQKNDLDLGDVGSQGKIKLPNFLYLPAKPTTKINYSGNLNSSIMKEKVDLPLKEDTYTSNVDEINKKINLKGKVTANGEIFDPKRGDIVSLTITDASGKSTKVTASLNENGEWSVDNADLPSNMDLSKPLKISATLSTSQEKANTQKYVTQLIGPNGEKNTLTINLTKKVPQDANSTTWNAVATVTRSDGSVVSTTNGSLLFDHTGRLAKTTLTSVDNGGTKVDLNFGNYVGNGYVGLTSSANKDTISMTQNGVEEGVLKEYATNDSGNIIANFTNGKSISVAKVALYHFQNDQGLSKLGSNVYAESANSGKAFFYKNAQGKTFYNSQIKNYNLEMSNVDLAQALTEVIVMQKGYDASAKSITTGDQMTQTAIQMKR